jgi:hypothetical protein
VSIVSDLTASADFFVPNRLVHFSLELTPLNDLHSEFGDSGLLDRIFTVN